MSVMLETRGLTVRYEHHIACDNLSFALEEGDYVAIVGENGSGKSTLVKTLVGLLKPSAGEVILHNLSKKEIGYLPQSTPVQRDFPATVSEVVLTGCIGGGGFRPFYSKGQKQAAQNAMELMNISPLSKKSFRELSGGQKQRVLLARALCATKKLLILDEPASVLDPVITHDLYSILKMLNETRGITILMVSHDIHCAVEQAKTILHMDKELLYYGTPEGYFRTELYQRMVGLCHADYSREHTHSHGHELHPEEKEENGHAD